MRLAFVSDLHANLQAWHAVWADMVSRGVDRVICLGDVVGYGPRPAEVLGSVYEKIDAFVLGNHDAVVAGRLDPSGFNPDARRMIDWTRQQLHQRAVSFFKRLPLLIHGGDFRCAHGAVLRPGRFYYVHGEKVARACWRQAPERFIFTGHTHQPCVHVLSVEGGYTQVAPADFTAGDGERYLVNVGSVGMPRDRDFRACYCIYDQERAAVSFRRVAFDLEAFGRDVETRIADARQARCVLAWFDARARRPLRASVDFAPARDREAAGGTARLEQSLRLQARRARRWQRLALAASVLLVSIAVAFFALYTPAPRRMVLRGPSLGDLQLRLRPDLRLFPAGRPAARRPGPGPGMAVILGHADKQSVLSGPAGLRLQSGTATQALEVIFPQVRVGAVGKLRVRLTGEKLPGFRGEPPLLAIDFIAADGRRRLRARSKTLAVTGKELKTRYTFRLTKNVVAVRARLVGTFLGSILLKELVVSAAGANKPKTAKSAGSGARSRNRSGTGKRKR